MENLSNDVLDRVFTFLPIEQAIQIGTISSRFQKTWLSCRKLYFDEDFARGRSRDEFVRIVDGIFNQHYGLKIQSFRLYFDPVGRENMVRNWIKRSTDKGVEELDLDFSQAETYIWQSPRLSLGEIRIWLSPRLFDIHSLKIIKLCFCKFYLPRKINGLRFLNTLVLRRVSIPSALEALLETVFENCMFLECLDITECDAYTEHVKIGAQGLKNFKTLRVGHCYGVYEIDIDAPSLVSFYYYGHPIDFNFVQVSKLNDVLIDVRNTQHFTPNLQLEKIAHDLSHVSVFSTSATFLEGISSNNGNGRLGGNQLCFGQLKELQLFMEGGYLCNVYDIVSFISNCPCLEKLFIDLQKFSFRDESHRELHEEDFLMFNCLQLIKIKCFDFKKRALQLVKYLLHKAISLKKLVLIKHGEVQAHDSQLIESWKASPKAQIEIYEDFNDISSAHAKHISRIWFRRGSYGSFSLY